MRPTPYETSTDIYECFDCGDRVEAPTTRVCGTCEGELLNLSVPRDT